MKVSEGAIRAVYVAMEQAAERVVITDRQGTILYVNPAFERVTGYAGTEAIGRTPRILKSGQHDQRFYQMLWDRLLNGRSFRARFVNKRKNGELYYEEQTISSLKDERGNITHFISTAVDITGQIAAEKARELAEESFQHLQEIALGNTERVIVLKHEVNALLQRLGQPPKYNL